MELLLFETDPTSVMLWTRIAASHGLRTTVAARFGADQNSFPSTSGITVVDEATVPHSFAATVARANRQDVSRHYIASGHSLAVQDVVSMMHHGVSYVLEKPLDPPRVASVMDYVVKKLEQTSAKVKEFESLSEELATLTQREVDVLNHVLEGTSNREAAEILGVSVRTVESRRAKLYRKLKAQTVAEVIRKVDRIAVLSKEVNVESERIASLPALAPHFNTKMSTVA
ncbi:MAG: hypothetical protein Aurels2KO_17480 [Aureliella sp.]